MWIQEWIDNRFGVPNTVNKQVYEDFAEELMGKAREAVEGAGLTDEEIRELWVAQYTEKWDEATAKEIVDKITFEFTKVFRHAQTKAILKALGGE
ncbi:hypothetical protein LCGC14_0384720 [marine sediment metagenome]|uniref:Uncharacterized protein n=1 Tax=marine sediment metagenome TaxID=412755 RepID=A0A0F9T142_9ZZZZ